MYPKHYDICGSLLTEGVKEKRNYSVTGNCQCLCSALRSSPSISPVAAIMVTMVHLQPVVLLNVFCQHIVLSDCLDCPLLKFLDFHRFRGVLGRIADIHLVAGVGVIPLQAIGLKINAGSIS